jgi:hypothetical protein
LGIGEDITHGFTAGRKGITLRDRAILVPWFVRKKLVLSSMLAFLPAYAILVASDSTHRRHGTRELESNGLLMAESLAARPEVRDIDHGAAEQAMLENEEEFRSVFDNSFDAILFLHRMVPSPQPTEQHARCWNGQSRKFVKAE